MYSNIISKPSLLYLNKQTDWNANKTAASAPKIKYLF